MARKRGKYCMGHDQRLRFVDPEKLAATAQRPTAKSGVLSIKAQQQIRAIKKHPDGDIAIAYHCEGKTLREIATGGKTVYSTVKRKLDLLQAAHHWPSYPSLVHERLLKGKTVLLDALACKLLFADRGWLVTLSDAHETSYESTHSWIEAFLRKHRHMLLAMNGRGFLLAGKLWDEDLYYLAVVQRLDSLMVAESAAAAQRTSLFCLREWRYVPAYLDERRKAA